MTISNIAAPAHSIDFSDQLPQIQAEIDRVFELQMQNRHAMAQTNARQRADMLKALRRSILKHQDAIRTAIQDDFSKHPTETDLTEIYPVTAEIKHALSHIHSWMRPQAVDTPIAMMGTQSEIRYEARGVCLIISPWNYPVQLALLPIVSAIAAGNTVILKPSEMTPQSSAVLESILSDCFREDQVKVIHGDASVATHLLSKPFHHIFFTGSPRVGKIVMAAAAKNLTSVTLELGGKSPVIIDEQVRMDEAATRIAWGKLLNKGQTCIAPDYAMVPQNKLQDFLSRLELAMQKLYGDNPQNESSYARIINHRNFERIKSLIDDAIDKGAELVFGGDHDGTENYLAPTVLTNVSPDMRIMQEEIFGPVLPVLTYNTLDEAIDFVNEGEKPLALYVFSKRSSTVDRVLQETTSGGVCVNDTILHHNNPNIPFGGVNNSGLGQSHGEFGFRSFSHARGVLKGTRLSAANLIYPPYGENSKKVAGLSIKYL